MSKFRTQRIIFELSEELRQKLRDVAAANERSLSGEIRYVLTRHIKEHQAAA